MTRLTRKRRRQDSRRRTVEIHEAFASRPALLRAAAAMAACALLAWGLGRWALESPRFAVQRISFQGLERAQEAELLRLSGIQPGQNLFALDLGQAARQMAGHPWVRAVRASRRFPSGVEVQVQEHAPVAVLAMGDLYLVDADGAPFKRLQPSDEVDRDQYLGDRPRWERRIQEALEVVQLYQARFPGPLHRLAEVRLSPLGLSLVAGPDGEEVHLGGSNFAEKLERLQRVRRALANRALWAEVIHLDDRRRPFRVAVRARPSSAPGWDPDSERSGARRPSPGRGEAR